MKIIQVKIDKTKCLGCEICMVICPEIFKIRNSSVEAAAGIVPEHLYPKCVEASESCPSEAIGIIPPNVWQGEIDKSGEKP